MFDSIALASQKCVRLKHLIIEFGGRHQSSSELSKRRIRLCQNDLPSPDTHTTLRFSPEWEPMTFDVWNLLKPMHEVDRALDSLMMLDARLVCPEISTLPTISIFTSLKHLRENGCPKDFLTFVVSSAPALESFGTIDAFGRPPGSLMSSLMNAPPLLKLGACSLSNVNDEDSLINFLLRQSDTLRRLRIYHGQYFAGPNWATVAARLKGKLHNLRRIELEIGTPTLDSRARLYNYDVMTEKDILQDHEHELKTDPMETYGGLWEDYEKTFFPRRKKL